jgi:Ca2+:H+ antiporter
MAQSDPQGRGAAIFPTLGLLAAAGLFFCAPLLQTAPPGALFAIAALAAILLIGSVFAALDHAEIVGVWLGEPYGTLVLTIAVTIIEVAAMASMIAHGADDPTEAREAVFSAIMIVCNGLVGLCLLLGGFRHGEQELQPMGASAYLAVLIALSVLTLIIPDYTTSAAGPRLTNVQLVFISFLSITLYGAFLFIQTVRHRSYFLDARSAAKGHFDTRPSMRQALFAGLGLVASLITVAVLADRVVPAMEEGFELLRVRNVNAASGAALAALVLLPESLNAIRAAARNALQTALNCALGSVVATIGLTVPAISFFCLLTGHDIVFGLEKRDTMMLLLTLLLSVVSFGAGRTNVLTGLVHLVVFAAYVFFIFVP